MNVPSKASRVVFSLGAGVSFSLFLLGVSTGNILYTLLACILVVGAVHVLETGIETILRRAEV